MLLWRPKARSSALVRFIGSLVWSFHALQAQLSVLAAHHQDIHGIVAEVAGEDFFIPPVGSHNVLTGVPAIGSCEFHHGPVNVWVVIVFWVVGHQPSLSRSGFLRGTLVHRSCFTAGWLRHPYYREALDGLAYTSGAGGLGVTAIEPGHEGIDYYHQGNGIRYQDFQGE